LILPTPRIATSWAFAFNYPVAIEEIVRIFSRIRFYQASYPEIERGWYALSRLNFRKVIRQETIGNFFIKGENLDLRIGFNSAYIIGQVREMERRKPRLEC